MFDYKELPILRGKHRLSVKRMKGLFAAKKKFQEASGRKIIPIKGKAMIKTGRIQFKDERIANLERGLGNVCLYTNRNFDAISFVVNFNCV